jgi:hypothetical protein
MNGRHPAIALGGTGDYAGVISSFDDPAGSSVRMQATSSLILTWPNPPTNSNAGLSLGRVAMWCDSTRQYRVRQFIDYGDEPFFAMVSVHGRRTPDVLSRHPTLEAAQAACDTHARGRIERIAITAAATPAKNPPR